MKINFTKNYSNTNKYEKYKILSIFYKKNFFIKCTYFSQFFYIKWHICVCSARINTETISNIFRLHFKYFKTRSFCLFFRALTIPDMFCLPPRLLFSLVSVSVVLQLHPLAGFCLSKEISFPSSTLVICISLNFNLQ